MSTNTLVLSRDQVFFAPGMQDSAGRSMGICIRNDGSKVNVVLEWGLSASADLEARIAKMVENIPTDGDVNRPEEVRTLKLEGLLNVQEQSLPALVYECPQKPLNLRDVLLTIAKPSGKDRGKLAGIIATQIRSLNVNFRTLHAGLRTESFTFFGDAKKPDLTTPYLLDWGHPASPSIYQHPDFQVDKIHWFYDVWSLMIVLSEIAEWKPVDGTFQDANELLRKKLQRKKEVMDARWKGDGTAKVMQFGFKFLEKDRSTLEALSRKEVKRSSIHSAVLSTELEKCYDKDTYYIAPLKRPFL